MNTSIIEASVDSDIEEAWPVLLEALQATNPDNLAVIFYGHLNALLGEMALSDWFTDMDMSEKTYATLYFNKSFTQRALSSLFPVVPSDDTEKSNG